MSQVQVLQRTEDQTSGNYQNFQENLQKQQEMLMKAKEMKVTSDLERERLKILAKGAATDAEKVKLTKDSQDMDLAAKYVDYLVKNNTKPDGTFDGENFEKQSAQLLMQPGNEGVMQQFARMSKLNKGRQMGDTAVAKDMSAMQLDRAKIGGEEASARLDRAKVSQIEAINKLIGGQLGGSQMGNTAEDLAADLSGEAGSPIMGAEGEGAQMPSAVRPRAAALANAARPSATGRQGSGYEVGDISLGPQGATIKISNPNREIELAAKKTQAGKDAELKSKRAEFGRLLDNFTVLFDALPRKENMAAAAASVVGRRIASDPNFGWDRVGRTYLGAAKNLKVAVARLKDVGNLSKPEQDAAQELVPTLVDDTGTANLKMAYLKTLGGVGSADALKKLIAKWSSTPECIAIMQKKVGGKGVVKAVSPVVSAASNKINAIKTDSQKKADADWEAFQKITGGGR